MLLQPAGHLRGAPARTLRASRYPAALRSTPARIFLLVCTAVSHGTPRSRGPGAVFQLSSCPRLQDIIRPMGPKNCALNEEDLLRWPICSQEGIAEQMPPRPHRPASVAPTPGRESSLRGRDGEQRAWGGRLSLAGLVVTAGVYTLLRSHLESQWNATSSLERSVT